MAADVQNTIVLLVSIAIMLLYRKQISTKLSKLKIPKLILALLVAIILITFEEDVNCMPAWCGTVLIPPTLWFLFVQVLILISIIMVFKAKSFTIPVMLYGLFGIIFEFNFGYERANLKYLAIHNPPLSIALAIWIGAWYAFLVILPITIIEAN